MYPVIITAESARVIFELGQTIVFGRPINLTLPEMGAEIARCAAVQIVDGHDKVTSWSWRDALAESLRQLDAEIEDASDLLDLTIGDWEAY